MTDPRIKRPCPFCGEAEHLTVQERVFPFPIVVGDDTVRHADGLEAYEEVDAIYCEACLANAPTASWNGEQPARVLAVMRDFDRTDDGLCGCGHDRLVEGAAHAMLHPAAPARASLATTGPSGNPHQSREVEA